MLTEIYNLLNLSNHKTNQPYLFCVCDKGVDSGFLIHHFVSYFLKQNCKVVLLSFSQAFNHFNGACSKLGSNLKAAQDNNQLMFIDGMRNLSSALNNGLFSDENPWKSCIDNCGHFDAVSLLELIITPIEQFRISSDTQTVLVIDNISTLVDIGASVKDIYLIVQYLTIFMREKLQGNMVIGCENSLGNTDENAHLVSNFILHKSDICIEARGLETGYCRDVHGQLHVTWFDRLTRGKNAEKTTQYKLTDKTCAVFAAGMSSAVL